MCAESYQTAIPPCLRLLGDIQKGRLNCQEMILVGLAIL